jgi:hypothetical protein
MKSHVFISYVHDDAEIVSKFVSELESSGIPVWLDKTNILPGVRWQLAIKSAISSGSFFVACFSNNYWQRDKTYMNEELVLAIEELRLRSIDRIWFIPICFEETEIPDRPIGGGETLRSIQYIDLSKNWNDGIQRIINVINPEKENDENSVIIKKTRERIRKLVDELGSYGVRIEIAHNDLVNYGSTSVPALIEGLKVVPVPYGVIDVEWERQIHIISILETIGNAARNSVPALIAYLKEVIDTYNDPYNVNLTWKVVNCLCKIRDEHAIPILLTIFEKVVEVDNLSYYSGYYEIGSCIIPGMIELLNHRELLVRLNACLVIGKNDPTKIVEMLPMIIYELKNENVFAAKVLFELAKYSSSAVPELIKSLKSNNPKLRAASARALGRIGDNTFTTLEALKKSSSDEDEEVALESWHALSRISDRR